MTLYHSEWATGRKALPTSREACGVVAQRFEINVSALAAAVANGDIIELAGLPAYHTVVDAIVDVDDLDTNGTPTAVFDVGIMSGAFGEVDAGRTCGAELFSGSTTAQAGGVARMTAATGFRIAATGSDRGIGVKFTAGPATAATSGVIALILFTKQ